MSYISSLELPRHTIIEIPRITTPKIITSDATKKIALFISILACLVVAINF